MKTTRTPYFITAVLCICLAGCARTSTDSTTITRGSAPVAGHDQKAGKCTPAEAITLLIEGNDRFASGQPLHPRQDPERRAELSTSQQPFAVIIGCSDSRTSPEVLFDQGLGDLFVIRVAGNVVDDHALGSVEYAVEHLHTQLVMVLGHARCGAISAARETVAAKGHAEGHVDSLVASIRPAVEATLGQDADATCKANIRNVVRALRDLRTDSAAHGGSR